MNSDVRSRGLTFIPSLRSMSCSNSVVMFRASSSFVTFKPDATLTRTLFRSSLVRCCSNSQLLVEPTL